MAKKRLMTSLAFTAALVGGGAAGAILGVPGVSGAQTTTVPSAPSTTVPGTGGTQTTPDRPHTGNCQNMGGTQAPGGTTPTSTPNASQTGFRRGPGRV